ncbi:hypothetical protein LOTGIDRAFT_206325 [Lottia gigantea]|uniref:CDC20/Fizzy WD40 domain-containing protein n=1 Tax=Lottia gigantea TaxID=225164 RepID=V3ZWY2_LOTGI|nr:hypothetical protein LOTGIDRAFT_206325 [Lottia gigantea]ESO96033.1 hypothetical protein LOTGIDRAFT_206325 [Lottia gigantea]
MSPTKAPRSAKTPGKTPKTPLSVEFIPNRATTNFDMGHFAVVNRKESVNDMWLEEERDEDNNIDYYQQHLNNALTNGIDPHKAKILSYKTKAPLPAEGATNNLKVLYSSGKCMASKVAPTRQIPKTSERILDAPALMDDYYLNLLDWSHHNYLHVALNDAVYMWDATEGSNTQLLELQRAEEYVSSIKCIDKDDFVAVGTSSGNIMIYDISTKKHVRTMTGHAARVGALDWNSYILSSGSRCGQIHHHDVRVKDHHVATLSNHTQEICGLRWSPDGRYLASGANDNLLNIWDATLGQNQTPVYSLTEHHSSVKAISWCPWQSSLLASGGGTSDRHIRFWNMTSGTCLNAVNTNSQVCSILWSQEHRELISGHGYQLNQLIVWKYPAMAKVAELKGHTARILHMSLSPDGTTVASAGADETIRFWRCFDVIKQQRKQSTKSTSDSIIMKQIR